MVNGRIERFGSANLQRGDLVELSPNFDFTKKEIKFETLYEDEDLLIVNKPQGWVCSPENTRRHFGKAVLIHRLDKDTTGVLALAKSDIVKRAMIHEFEEKQVEKEYLAIVDGIPGEQEGTIESYLQKKGSFDGQTIWGSGSGGIHALTHWKRVAVGNDSSILHVKPITGRTHQIRVHLAELGHPILTDRQYAATFRCKRKALRPLLHAFRLRLANVFVEAPIPLDMLKFSSSICLTFPSRF